MVQGVSSARQDEAAPRALPDPWRVLRGRTWVLPAGLAALALALLAARALRAPPGAAVTETVTLSALAFAAVGVLAGRSLRAAAAPTAEDRERPGPTGHAERQGAVDGSQGSAEELRRLNAELARNVEDLLARNREFILLGDLTATLQGCPSLREAEAALAAALPALFPTVAGTLYLGAPGAAPMTPAACWGDAPGGARPYPFGRAECSALRLRRYHVAGTDGFEGPCPHVAGRPGWTSACIPLPSQGAASGVLTLVAEGELPRAGLQLARAVTDAVGLSLANLRLRESLHQQSISDPLTGLHNRRFMQESLTRELLRSRRTGRPVGLCMIDVDHFKRFNDLHGHDAGDAVLLEVGRLLRDSVRASDVVCRYGGEEFTIILPESRLEATLERAHALVRACRALRVPHLGRVLDPVTISIGIAEYPGHADGVDALLRRADGALYAAKQAGRDRVAVAGGGPPGQDPS